MHCCIENVTSIIVFIYRRKSVKEPSEMESSLNQRKSLVSHDSLNFLPSETCPTIEVSDNAKNFDVVIEESKSLEVTVKDIPNSSSSEECVPLQNGSMKKGKNTEEQQSCCSIFRSKSKPQESKKTFIELSLLKDDRFLSFCVAILLFTLAFQSAFVFLPAYGKQLGTTDMEAAYLVIITGAFDGVGRVLSGIVLDMEKVKPFRVYIYNTIMFFVGFISFVIPLTRSYGELCVVCGVYGILIGAYISQKSVILVDLLGAEKLINSFGLLICFQGIGMLVGPPFSGKDFDIPY